MNLQSLFFSANNPTIVLGVRFDTGRVPEPASLALVGPALLAAGAASRRAR